MSTYNANKAAELENRLGIPAQRDEVVLTYHEVWPESSDYLYSIDCRSFTDHLSLVRDLVPGNRRVHVTFDDGHISTYEHAAPVLDANSISATFFITAGWTGVRREYMNWSHLRELCKRGHRVQSHGWSHSLLTRCSTSELQKELDKSKSELEYRLGRPVEAISLPGGRWDRRVMEACASAGYGIVYTSDFWVNTIVSGITMKGRFMVHRYMDAQYLRRVANGSPVLGLRLRLKAEAKHVLQRALGDQAYDTVWRVLAGKNLQHGNGET